MNVFLPPLLLRILPLGLSTLGILGTRDPRVCVPYIATSDESLKINIFNGTEPLQWKCGPSPPPRFWMCKYYAVWLVLRIRKKSSFR